MSDAGSPFWRFSLKLYGRPGVADACLALQDQAGVDVNVLFYLLWNASERRAVTEADVRAVERAIGPWREIAVVPLRNVRRALKSPPAAVAPERAQSLRNLVKKVELEAERLQQETLYAMAQTSAPGHAAESAEAAARESCASYQVVLKRPLPKAPLDAVLAAFVAITG